MNGIKNPATDIDMAFFYILGVSLVLLLGITVTMIYFVVKYRRSSNPEPADITSVMPGRDEHRLCDSVELLVAPSRTRREFVHWVVDSRGTVFDAKATEQADGRVTYSRRLTSAARIAARRGADRWVVEMAVPASELGFSPREGTTRAVLLCRNIVHTRRGGEEEQTANLWLDGSNFHTVAKFAHLRFAGAGERPPRVPDRLPVASGVGPSRRRLAAAD